MQVQSIWHWISHSLAASVIIVTGCFPVASTEADGGLVNLASATRTFLGGPGSRMPGPADLTAITGTTLFEVGSLVNQTGVALNPSSLSTLSRAGTFDLLPALALAVHYDTGADTFTVSGSTTTVLEVLVKLGHPEGPPWPENENQMEEFDLILRDPDSSTTVELLTFVDDVDLGNGDEDDGYYRYVFESAELPAGTWYPTFEVTNGSIDYLTRLTASGPSTLHTPEPSAIPVLSAVLTTLICRRRRRH